jgi:PDZ domain
MSAAFSLLTSGAAWAQVVTVPETPDDAANPRVLTRERNPLADLVAELGADEFKRREAAEAALRSLPAPRVRDLESMLADRSLSSEQRVRLSGIVREAFVQTPRAALGVQYGGLDGDPAVISNTIEGFDSHRVLKSGDAIRSFDGMTVSDRETLRPYIMSYDPGDIATVEIVRDDEVLELRVRMGSQDQLRQNDRDRFRFGNNEIALRGTTQEPTIDELEEAWDLRLTRLGVPIEPMTDVVDGELSPKHWAEAAAIIAETDEDRRGRPFEARVAAGGQPRGGTPDSLKTFQDGELLHSSSWRESQRDSVRLVESTIDQLRIRERDLEQRLGTLRGQLLDSKAANAQERRFLQTTIDNLDFQLSIIRQQLRAMRPNNDAPRGQPQRPVTPWPAQPQPRTPDQPRR